MINSQFGCTTINGAESEILADFSGIVNALYEGLKERYSEDETMARIAHAYERAFQTEDDLRKEVEKSEEKVRKVSKVVEALADLLEAMGIDSDEEGDEEDGSAE